jgi:hypothetical protein
MLSTGDAVGTKESHGANRDDDHPDEMPDVSDDPGVHADGRGTETLLPAVPRGRADAANDPVVAGDAAGTPR